MTSAWAVQSIFSVSIYFLYFFTTTKGPRIRGLLAVQMMLKCV